jgi:hypothetical protein
MTDRIVRGQSPAWYHRIFNLFGNVLAWLFMLLAWFITTLACLDYLHFRSFVHTNGTRHLGLRRDHGVLLLSSHRTLVDSFILGFTFHSFWDFLLRPRSILWNVPEMKNYQFTWLMRFLIDHLHCVPVVRGNKEATMTMVCKTHRLLKSGKRVCIFPTAGREHPDHPLTISMEMGATLLVLIRNTNKLHVITAKMNGIPVWAKGKMGGSVHDKLWQFWWTVLRQTQKQQISVLFKNFNVDKYCAPSKVDEGLTAEFVAELRRAIKPDYPDNPAELQFNVTTQPNNSPA